MQITGKQISSLRVDAKDFINLYASLGGRAENFIPDHILSSLKNFVRICHEEPIDPAKQQAEINKYILELKELIPGYTDVSLMLFPHEDSKAFQYRSKKQSFENRLKYFIDTESVDDKTKEQTINILNTHDYSVGTPPVSQAHLDLMYKLCLGDDVQELRKFRDVIGVIGDVEEAQWNYFMDVLEQMIIQSSHYTTAAEKTDFLNRTNLTVNFKGLNGFIKTVVGGGSDTVIGLLSEEVFDESAVKVIEFKNGEDLFNKIKTDRTSIFIVKVKNMRTNIFNEKKWFPYLTRLVIVDDSPESGSTNTSLVFCFHNKIINTLNKVHTKKLGALANSQLNLRLILDKVNLDNLETFRKCTESKIADYEEELKELKTEQLGEDKNLLKDINLFKFNEFAKQIIKDKYAITKLHDYIVLVQNCKDPKKLKKQNSELINEFETRTKAYFYSNIEQVKIATIVEGGGRSQIRTYGKYLLQRKLKALNPKIIEKCQTIIDIIPDNYQRTLNNHFHKNFGINLFLEKYKEYITKVENEADNKGRFKNLLIDLGIKEAYDKKSADEQNIIKDFVSNLSNLEITSIADDVQMIIRDILSDSVLMPYILFNQEASWEYKDLFPEDRFDINPFDLEIGLNASKHIDFERLHHRLSRMKNTFQLFDDTGNLWDRFCENLTIIINDPSNPSGYTDFNDVSLIKFLKFLNNSKITLLLDEAYNDAIKVDDPDEPKWRTISRYIMNNISSLTNISVVSSLSTTKNLGATGSRLGSIVATPARTDVINFAKKQNGTEKGNTNSLYMLVNTIEAAQLAKKIKDRMESELPKEASRFKIKARIEKYIIDEIESFNDNKAIVKQGKAIKRFSPFEGSPLHLFLLEELSSLDKLDVLDLPDDFKYKGEPFFKYYQSHLVKEINKFRVNKNFRSESLKRLKLSKKVAAKVIEDRFEQFGEILPSDGSYLFNIQLKEFFSYQDLEKFTKVLARERGIAVIPYQTGFLRFSLGDYIEGTSQSYEVFEKELENALNIVLKYWEEFYSVKSKNENKEKRSEDILKEIFATVSDKEFINNVLTDFNIVKNIKKKGKGSLAISNIMTLYHAFPKDCGVSINTIADSKNSVFEFYENVGKCRDLNSFIESKAFTKVYENLLPQIYKNIPQIKNLDYNTVISKYGKPTILKYINNKMSFKPNDFVLDDPDERNIMTEILIELEKILFSDAKVKIMALNASDDIASDKAKLEGTNIILRKYIQELLIHFNLPFEQPSQEPTIEDIINKSVVVFKDVVGASVSEFNLVQYLHGFVNKISFNAGDESFTSKIDGYVRKVLNDAVMESSDSTANRLLKFYMLKLNNNFVNRLQPKISKWYKEFAKTDELEVKMFNEQFVFNIVESEIEQIINDIIILKDLKITEDQVHKNVRDVVLFFIGLMNKTKSTEYYDKYNHTLIKFVETSFREQNSYLNEMIQHGLTIHSNLDNRLDTLEKFEDGSLKWIDDVMKKCGVIGSEQPVQTHTRIVTDAKKREYPFHKIDRKETCKENVDQNRNDYIKNLDTKLRSGFFGRRVANFVEHMDPNDYRCKVIKHGLVKVLYVIQKSYIKYLTDNYRLLTADELSLDDLKDFVPDVILFYGAPEKVISYPQIGYFDLKGPFGNIKTLVTPLKKKVDYFGDIKKPWLTMINEKVKEMGGMPVHGSLFAIEEEDGSVFVVQIEGDSGVGKSEMLAAMMLKWLRNDLPGIRSIKLIAGDMFFVFPDKDGNLYGVGTEDGDFSRVTDFDPDFIKYYNSLFESAADSNVEDLNSRSTISGLCDIKMPYKIDIMLTASNYGREEAGITRYKNPENFLLYRDSHGERKEKATSSDNPHFQRTLLRYSGDKDIVEVLDKHGNYLDDILDWEKDEFTNMFYLCSSYKLMDRIDVEEVVNQIFNKKEFVHTNGKKYKIKDVKFDIIKNRFLASVKSTPVDEEESVATEIQITRALFSGIFNSLASTPAGQPFIAEEGQYEITKSLVNILKGGDKEKGHGKHIQLGILSTDLGRKGKEITGPQAAAQDMIKMIQEVRIAKPEINANKNLVQKAVYEKYEHVFKENQHNSEVCRNNFYLFQLEQMRKAKFVRMDNLKESVDLSNIKGFVQVDAGKEFSPLLVTPNINVELNGFTETYEQLMSLPGNIEFAEEFYQNTDKLYVAEGYNKATIENNMILQLLLLNGYLTIEDLTKGRITEKVNRETLAAAKYAVVKKLSDSKTAEKKKISKK
ncbi:MAG: aminotransferase class I/II-fold pyridoxal phosphate-dependent enzyme [Melioribacteraceae bacterium]|nr:aminotransferase class I/II-fold pyridoxal phosphate-dependent enzyme [Melioribacteraceae bacterium]